MEKNDLNDRNDGGKDVMRSALRRSSPRAILAATIIASPLPFLVVLILPSRFHHVVDRVLYLLFHNVAEFFSIMVSLSIFGVGWYTYKQSRDRHALFLSSAFLAIGLMDFMHTLANAAMPAFVTANSSNKSTQFWIVARLISAASFLVSAFIYQGAHTGRLKRVMLSRTVLMAGALGIPLVLFAGITFFPSFVPNTYIPGVGLTSFKVYSEYLVVLLLCVAAAAYWRRMVRTNDGSLMYYVAAFVICAFGELVFAAYKTVFDTYNVLGHVYKIVAFFLIYKGMFIASVRNPYMTLATLNSRLDEEVRERKVAQAALQRLLADLEVKVTERTEELTRANRLLQEEIVERERAQTSLRESERRWATTLASIGDGVIATDRDGYITFMNGVAEKLTGWISRDAVSKPVMKVFNIISEETREAVSNPVVRVLMDGLVVGLANHTILVRRDGAEIPIDDSGAPIRDGNGNITGVVLVFRDIVERRRAEEALHKAYGELEHRVEERTAELRDLNWALEEGIRDRERLFGELDEQRARLEAIIATMPAALFITDDRGGLRFANDAAKKLWGGVAPMVAGCEEYGVYKGRWADTGRQLGAFDWNASRALTRGETSLGERIEIERFDGSTGTALFSAAPIRNAEGAILGAVTIALDITEQRQIEERLRQAQKMEAIGTLAGGIAHDFNNILGGIIGFAEMVLDDVPPDTPAYHQLQLVLDSGLRGRDLVKQILAFSRKTEHKREILSLAPLVTETVRLLRASLPATIRISVNVSATSDMVFANASEIQQIAMNLCTNAAHAMGENGGELTISLGDADGVPTSVVEEPFPGGYVELVVKDTGTGIDAGVIKRIFEPFFTTKGIGKGTGMGLAVVYGIVKSLDGHVAVESEPGVGSTFRVFLPKMKADARPPAKEVEDLPGGTERILFVDDEILLREWGKAVLERLGYTVTVASDGLEALKIFSEDPFNFDLVFTDQTMPRITGHNLAREIRKIRPDMAVILCTGHSDAVSAETAEAEGIGAFLMKPLRKHEMGRTVRRVLDGRSGVR